MKRAEYKHRTNVALRFQEFIDRILSNDPAASRQLEAELHSGIRFYLRRSLCSGDIEGHIAAVKGAVVNAIRRREITDAGRLFSAVRSILATYVVTQQPMSRLNIAPVQPLTANAIKSRQNELARLVGRSLAVLSEQERAALSRFYVQNEQEDRICQALGITNEQLVRMRTRLRSGVVSRLSQPFHLSMPCQ